MMQGSVEDNLMVNVNENSKSIMTVGKAVNILHKLEFDERKLNSSHTSSWNSVLSEGEKAKIAIARTLAGDHRVVLMDEPTAALDQRSKFLLEELLTQESKRRMIIVVTHEESLLRLSEKQENLWSK
jgi:ABC-type transport system involved in cytochrome bd biosynthesis fused ATPase/permease subunit